MEKELEAKAPGGEAVSEGKRRRRSHVVAGQGMLL